MEYERVYRQVDRTQKPTIDVKHRVKDIEHLRKLLQSAIKLEAGTIPPYLCALYSIHEGTNRAACDVILSVVMEEMLHLGLAANVLIAIGGKPIVNQKPFIPEYPLSLAFLKEPVDLQRFSRQAIETFIDIERPDDDPVRHQPEIGAWRAAEFKSIGQFYELIELGLIELSRNGGKDIFTGKDDPQLGPESYYGGGGGIVRVCDLESALEALKEIVDQGEGIPHSFWEEPHPNPKRQPYLEVAHFYRFIEIREERRFKGSEPIRKNVKEKYPLPKGEPFPVDWTAVYPMRRNPKTAQLPDGSEVLEKATAFNRTYMLLLNTLHDAVNGRPAVMQESIGIMHDLRQEAVELMKIPLPGSTETVGPSFEFLELCP
jgi:hypothetical protein